MKGLFKEVKKEPTQAGVFKFAFKLGFDEDELEEPAVKSAAKKNKNKKKKKKKSSSTDAHNNATGMDDDENDDEGEEVEHGGPPAPLPDGTQDHNSVSSTAAVELALNSLSLGNTCDSTPIESASATQQNTVAASEATQQSALSKSQKKNLKKKKAKKAGGGDTEGTEETEGVQQESTHQTVLPASKSSATPSKVAGSKPSNTSKTTTEQPAKKDDEQARREALLKAQQIRAMLDLHEQKQSPVPASTVQGGSSHHSSSGTGSGNAGVRVPHFLSSKDPELDEASRLRYRYGMGRNLVAIGPIKVRDPNWLPPPPGLTKKAQAPAGTATATTAPAAISPFKKGIAKTSGAKAAGGVSSGVQEGSTSSTTEGQSHSSPFSFSFNGL